MSDIERDDSSGAPPEQHVSEAAGRRAHVQRLTVPDVDAEDVERVRQLDAAATDVGVIGCEQRHFRIGGHRRAGLRLRLAVDPDLPGEDQRSGALARRREASIDQQQVKTDAGASRQQVHLVLSGEHPFGDGPEPAVGQAGVTDGCAAALDALGRQPARTLQAKERGIRRFGVGGVLAGRLAERRGVAFDVEDVVDDLKREPKVRRVPIDRGDERFSPASHDGAADGRRTNHGAGLLARASLGARCRRASAGGPLACPAA